MEGGKYRKMKRDRSYKVGVVCWNRRKAMGKAMESNSCDNGKEHATRLQVVSKGVFTRCGEGKGRDDHHMLPVHRQH